MRVCIFGSGQAGRMVRRWLPAELECVCFSDNNPALQGTYIDGIPVCGLPEVLLMDIDIIFLAVLNRDALASIREQVAESGFTGSVEEISFFRQFQDIRLAQLRLYAGIIREKQIPGALAELGVYRGDFAREMNRLLPDRKLYLFDTFTGFDERDLGTEKVFRDFSDTSADYVRGRLPRPEQAVFVEGYFPDSVRDAGSLPETYALVSIDPDLYAPAAAGLAYFYERLSPGGMILLHDFTSSQFPGVGKAAREFEERTGVHVIPLMDLHGTGVLIRS